MGKCGNESGEGGSQLKIKGRIMAALKEGVRDTDKGSVWVDTTRETSVV